MSLILYYAPIACSLVAYVNLTEAKAPFEARPLNMGKRAQFASDYLKLNPKHKVPTLVVDGEPLTENVAIAQWVARRYPETKVLPADPWKELKAVSLMAWCASGIHPFLTRINTPARVCDVAGTEESVKRLAQEALFEAFAVAEDMLDGREFFFDHFTAPDAHFFWCFRRAGQFGIDLSKFKACSAHFTRMQARDSVKKVLAFEKSVQAEFAKAA
jgi:glutathione S-transferase